MNRAFLSGELFDWFIKCSNDATVKHIAVHIKLKSNDATLFYKRFAAKPRCLLFANLLVLSDDLRESDIGDYAACAIKVDWCASE